jgi:hypothetical protein
MSAAFSSASSGWPCPYRCCTAWRVSPSRAAISAHEQPCCRKPPTATRVAVSRLPCERQPIGAARGRFAGGNPPDADRVTGVFGVTPEIGRSPGAPGTGRPCRPPSPRFRLAVVGALRDEERRADMLGESDGVA